MTDKAARTAAGYLDDIGPRLTKAFLDRGLLLRPLGNVLYFMPPYVVTESETAWAIEQIRDVLDGRASGSEDLNLSLTSEAGAIINLMAPRSARRAALWIVWAIVVWNVVFDHVIVAAGREYLRAALAAAQGTGPYAHMDTWMRPAITRGLWIATGAAGMILLVGFAAIRRGTGKHLTKGPARSRTRTRASARAA